jgi:predicted nuclease with TOPRIM domain
MTSETAAALEQLEARVTETVDRQAALRERNAELEARVAEVEQAQAARSGEPDAAWAEERTELRQRVERLIAQLESLAED